MRAFRNNKKIFNEKKPKSVGFREPRKNLNLSVI